MGKGGIKKGDKIRIVGTSDPANTHLSRTKYEGKTGTVTSTENRPLINVRLDDGITGAFCESFLRREPQ